MSSGRLNDLLTTKQQQDEDEGIKQNLFVLVEDVSTKLDDSHNSFNISVLWQIIPVSISFLFATCFGIMLGWPSPIYPKLLQEDTPIPITLDLTAMIAGFLMLGNIVSTPFSTWSYTGNKYGIIIGLILMTIGWLIMWQARNFYWVLISRFVIGLGSGFGLGQLKLYAKEMCQADIAKIFKKVLNAYIIFGIIIVCSIGPYFDFRTLSLISTFVCVFVAGLCLLLPHTPYEYLRMNQEGKSKKMLRYLQPQNVDRVFNDLRDEIDAKEINLSLGQILRKKETRCNVIILTCLIYFQQFTGPPATIVYSQIIFKELQTDNPELCAIVYIIVFLFSNLFATFSLDNYNKKYCLLFSCVPVSIILTINILIIYYKYNETYWNYISFVLMLLYMFFHTIGLGIVPATFLEETFKKDSQDTLAKGFWMLFSALALLITKIFQVLYERCDFYIPFCMFLCNSILAIIFTLIFYPNKCLKDHEIGVPV